MYEITLQDIKHYLASLGPDEEAGVTEHPLQCLVARTLSKKYSKTFRVDSDRFTLAEPATPWLEVPQEIQIIIGRFDTLGTLHSSITRQQVEDNIVDLTV